MHTAIKRVVSEIANDSKHQRFIELFRQRDSGELNPESQNQLLDSLYSEIDQETLRKGALLLFKLVQGGEETELGAHLFVEQLQKQMPEYFTWGMTEKFLKSSSKASP